MPGKYALSICLLDLAMGGENGLLAMIGVAAILAGYPVARVGLKLITRTVGRKAVKGVVVERFERGDSPLFPSKESPPEYLRWAEDRLSDYSLAKLKAIPAQSVYFIYLIDYMHGMEFVRAPIIAGPTSDRWEPGAQVDLLINERDPRAPEVGAGSKLKAFSIGTLLLVLGGLFMLFGFGIFVSEM
jgi:hypothetical protein